MGFLGNGKTLIAPKGRVGVFRQKSKKKRQSTVG
jgi:hypothetical protein